MRTPSALPRLLCGLTAFALTASGLAIAPAMAEEASPSAQSGAASAPVEFAGTTESTATGGSGMHGDAQSSGGLVLRAPASASAAGPATKAVGGSTAADAAAAPRAASAVVDGVTYEVDDATAKTAYVKGVANLAELPTDLAIPDTVKIGDIDYTVVRIGEAAFMNNGKLLKVTFPGTITTIGVGAFCHQFEAQRTSLKEIDLSAITGALTIGQRAFTRTSLAYNGENPLKFSSSRLDLDFEAFSHNTGLTAVDFSGVSEALTIGTQSFWSTPLSSTPDRPLVFNAREIHLGASAFAPADGITGAIQTVAFTDSVASLTLEGATLWRAGLQGTLVLPTGTVAIDSGFNFGKNPGLTDVVFPAGVPATFHDQTFNDYAGRVLYPLNNAAAFEATDAIKALRPGSDPSAWRAFPDGAFTILDAGTDATVSIDQASRTVTVTALNGPDASNFAFGSVTHTGVSASKDLTQGHDYSNGPIEVGLVTHRGTEAAPVTETWTVSVASVPRVTFDAHGGTPEPAYQDVPAVNGQPGHAERPDVEPTLEGKAFHGWHATADGTDEPFDFDATPITANTTLNAVWVKPECAPAQPISACFSSDAGLAAAVANALYDDPAAVDEPVTTRLRTLPELDAAGYGVATLADIDALAGLQWTDLSDNKVGDATPLTALNHVWRAQLDDQVLAYPAKTIDAGDDVTIPAPKDMAGKPLALKTSTPADATQDLATGDVTFAGITADADLTATFEGPVDSRIMRAYAPGQVEGTFTAAVTQPVQIAPTPGPTPPGPEPTPTPTPTPTPAPAKKNAVSSTGADLAGTTALALAALALGATLTTRKRRR